MVFSNGTCHVLVGFDWYIKLVEQLIRRRQNQLQPRVEGPSHLSPGCKSLKQRVMSVKWRMESIKMEAHIKIWIEKTFMANGAKYFKINV